MQNELDKMLWRFFFPFPTWRPSQADGLDFMCQGITEADDVFLEAPTGIGKSAMAIALAQLAAWLNVGTYISTTTISLEEQYMRDFAKLRLQRLHSKSHYPCPQCQSCDVGSRELKLSDGSKFCRCKEDDCCTYRLAKVAFQMGSFGIANAAYMCTCARFAPDWLLHDTIAGGYSFEIKNTEIDYFPDEDGELEWLENHYAFKLAVQIRELEELLERTDKHDPEIQKICRKLERAEGKQQNLQQILGSDPDYWIFDQQDDRLSISPLWATEFAAKLLPQIGQKRVYLSATLPGFKHQARYLGVGVKPGSWRFRRLFPWNIA